MHITTAISSDGISAYREGGLILVEAVDQVKQEWGVQGFLSTPQLILQEGGEVLSQ